MKFPAGISEFIDKDGNAIYPDAQGHVNAPAAQILDYQKAGFQAYDVYMLKQAANANMVFVVSPATLSTAHGSAANRIVTITLQNSAGETHTWYNRAVATGVSVAKSSSAGTVTIPSTTLTFVNGVATVTITEGGTWAGADTDTLTIAAETIFGFSVASQTSVETMS